MLNTVKAYLLYTWGGLHRYFGNQNNEQQEYERAIHYFTRAYRTDPTMRQARLSRGILLWRELDRIDEAIADFDGLLAEDDTYRPALLNRALAYQQAGRYQQALNDLEEYLQLPPDEDYRDLAVRMHRLLQEMLDE